MIVFLDTEFEDLCAGAGLLSMGFAAENGDELYIELTNGWSYGACSDFVLDHVIPLFDAEPHERMTRAQAAGKVADWLRKYAESGVVRVVSDSTWDWEHLIDLLRPLHEVMEFSRTGNVARLGDIELKFSMPTISADDQSAFNYAYETFFEGGNPEGKKYMPHHALVDARALRHAVMAAGNKGACV